jgi:uncharacterized protein (DUF433 family)
MDEHPLIYFREGAAGRRPALLGTRLDVAGIIDTIRQNGNSVEAAAEYLELPIEKIDACLRYYTAFKDEVDEWIERATLAVEREETLWRRRQEVLA